MFDRIETGKIRVPAKPLKKSGDGCGFSMDVYSFQFQIQLKPATDAKISNSF